VPYAARVSSAAADTPQSPSSSLDHVATVAEAQSPAISSVSRPPASPSTAKAPSPCPQELEGHDEPPHDLIPKLQAALPRLCGLGSIQFKLICPPRKRANKSFTLGLMIDQQMVTISARAYAHHGLSNRPWVDVPCWMCSVTCVRSGDHATSPVAVLMHGKLGLSRQLIRLTHARALGVGPVIDLKAFESFPHDSPGCDTHLLSLSAEYTLHFFGPRCDAPVRLLELRKEGAFDVTFFNVDGANIDASSFSLGPEGPSPSFGDPAAPPSRPLTTAAAPADVRPTAPTAPYHAMSCPPTFGPIKSARKTRLARLERSSVSHIANASAPSHASTASSPAAAILPGFSPSLPNFMAASTMSMDEGDGDSPLLFSSALSVAPSPTEVESLPSTVFELPDEYSGGGRPSIATPPDSASIADTVLELPPFGEAASIGLIGAMDGMVNGSASLFPVKNAFEEEFKPSGPFLPSEHLLSPLFGADSNSGFDVGHYSFSFPPASEYFPPMYPSSDSLFARDSASEDFLAHSY